MVLERLKIIELLQNEFEGEAGCDLLEVAEVVDDLIARYGLHDGGAPVDLSPLKEEFVPLVEPFDETGIPAFSMPPRGGVVSPDLPVCVVLDELQPEATRLVYYAHEIGHILCGHPGSLRTLEASDWWHSRDERQAWEVATLQLTPAASWDLGATTGEVGGTYEVPGWLAEMYPRWW